MTPDILAKRLRTIQRRHFNRIKFQTENRRIRVRLELESMTDDERIADFITCEDCGELRVPLEVAKCLAASATTVPECKSLIDAQEAFWADLEAMTAMGPHQ